MARGEDWARLVPPEVARALRAQGLVRRFREEFGLEVLAREAPRAIAVDGDTGG